LSGGRWFLAAVSHASLNRFGGSFFTAMVTGADQARFGLLLSAIYVLLAIAGLVLGRGYNLTGMPDPAVEATDSTTVSTTRA